MCIRDSLVLQMRQSCLNVSLDLGVISARITSQDRLGDELASRKILPYGDAARPPVAEIEARREDHAGLDSLTHRLGKQGLLIAEGPLPSALPIGPGHGQRCCLGLPSASVDGQPAPPECA